MLLQEKNELQRLVDENIDLSSVTSLGLVLPQNFQANQAYFSKVPNLKHLFIRISSFDSPITVLQSLLQLPDKTYESLDLSLFIYWDNKIDEKSLKKIMHDISRLKNLKTLKLDVYSLIFNLNQPISIDR